MDNIMRFIEAARRRLQTFRAAAWALYGLAGGIAAGLLLLLLGRLLPIPSVRLMAAILAAAGLLGGLLWGWLRRIPVREAASAMDEVPEGPERSDMMVTALSFREDNSPAAVYQRRQAELYGSRFEASLKDRMPRPKRKKALMICSAGLVALMILMILPNPMNKVVEAAKEQKKWVKEQVKETDKLVDKLNRQQLSEQDKKKLQEQIEALKKELASAKHPEKVLEKLEEVMKQLEKTMKQQEENTKALSKLAEQMKNHPSLEKAGKSLQNGKSEELKKEMKKLTEEVKKMSDKDKTKLAEELKKLAKEAEKHPDAEKLKEALEKAADALKNGKLTKEQEEALKELAEELAKAAEAKNSSDEASEAASELAAALASQGLTLADKMSAAGMKVSDAWSTGGSAEAMAQAGLSPGEQGEGGENPSGGEQGKGGSQGQGGAGSGGQGQGAGSGGSGSGTGSGRGHGQGAGAGGAGLGTGSRELVTTPRDLKGGGNVQGDKGPLKGSGGEVQKGGVSPTVPGSSRPYEEVYKDYAAEARKTLGRSQLPEQMQGLVEDYFTGINPNP